MQLKPWLRYSDEANRHVYCIRNMHANFIRRLTPKRRVAGSTPAQDASYSHFAIKMSETLDLRLAGQFLISYISGNFSHPPN